MSELSEAAARDRADTAFLVGCAHGRAMGAAEVLAARAEAWDDRGVALCHCGRPVTYGYDGDPTHHRGMCEDCDAVRCDAYPDECPRRANPDATLRASLLGGERCFVAVVDGTTVAYRADEPLDETGQRALEALVRAAVHQVQVTDPDLEERQAAARERNRARLLRLGLITPDQEDR